MRSLKKSGPVGGLSLPLVCLLLAAGPGCNKIKELTGGEEEAADNKDGSAEAAAPAEAAAEPEVAEVEEVPAEPPRTGLDLMLKLVPDDKSQFVVIRDATVLADYGEEAVRFMDGPMGKLAASPFKGEEADTAKANENFNEFRTKFAALGGALKASGIKLEEGMAVVMTPDKKPVLIFNAASPDAITALAKAMDAKNADKVKCKALDEFAGYNVCADDQATIDAYKPGSDPEALRKSLTDGLPGVDLDEANVVAHVTVEEKDEVYTAITTFPGLIHAAVGIPAGPDADKLVSFMNPGEAKTLGSIAPGAGFIWGRVDPKVLKELPDVKKAPAPIPNLVGSMTGEFLVGGSIDPAGLLFQAGVTDTAAFSGVVDMGAALEAQVPKEIPGEPKAKVVFEKIEIDAAGGKANALHAGVTDLSEAEVLASFTGLHMDAWMFAAGDVFTVAVGPKGDKVGKLAETSGSGPSDATLDALPPQLARDFRNNEVSYAAHFPVDFVNGAHMHKIIRSALKNVPDANPDQVLSVMAMVAPLSSFTAWISKTQDKPVIHVAIQGFGNRATEEGKAALDAAHAVADGADPETTFASLVSTYSASPRVFTYKTRAGTDGPGSMVGSGVGAVIATAALAVPVALGARNDALAADLGVKPGDPEPELKVTPPPKPKPKKPRPKKPKAKDPKDPKDPKPVVEPDRPKPPVPTPTPPKNINPGRDPETNAKRVKFKKPAK